MAHVLVRLLVVVIITFLATCSNVFAMGFAAWFIPQGPGWIYPGNKYANNETVKNQPFAAVFPDIGFDVLPFIEIDIGTYLLAPMLALTILRMLLDYTRISQYFLRMAVIISILLVYRTFALIFTGMSNPYPGCYNCGFDKCPETVWGSIAALITKFRDCGDLMFSGHTIFYVLIGLYWWRTAKNKYWWPGSYFVLLTFAIFVWAYCLTGALLLISTRMHYTSDIVVAFFVTILVWVWYHNCVERFDETNVIGEPNIFEKLILFIENIEYTRDENYAIMTHRFEKISNNQQDEIDPR